MHVFECVFLEFKNGMGLVEDFRFDSFDEEPIAAASLAQVHRGFLKDGQKVAVKVSLQHLYNLSNVNFFTVFSGSIVL